jgi:hypothetical protein
MWQEGWFSWDEEQQAAFLTRKEVTCTITRLVNPHPTTAISLAIDASNTTWGLSYSSGHNEAGSLSFYSTKKLDLTPQKYSAFD